MIALADAGLAHMAIAATAIGPSDRGRWLRTVADELDPSPDAVIRAHVPAGNSGIATIVRVRLTRVTRIFQKNVFTKATSAAPGWMPRRAFLLRGREPRLRRDRGGFVREDRDQPAAVENARRLRSIGSGLQCPQTATAPEPRRALHYCQRYSAIVRTTLEVGRPSPPPPGPFTSLRICSS